MRFRVDTGLLRKHLDFVKPRRTRSLPILEAVNLVACEAEGKLFLSQQNTDHFLRSSLRAAAHSHHATRSGQVVVDWFELIERLKGHRGMVILEETLTSNEDESLQDRKRLDILIEDTGARTWLPVINPEHLPGPLSLHAGRRQYSLKFPAGELLDVIARALPVASKEDIRLHIRGVHIRTSQKETGGVRIAATDGACRVFVQDLRGLIHTEGNWEFVLPERFCKDLLRSAALVKPDRSAEITLTADAWQQSDVDAREKERKGLSDEELRKLPSCKLGTGRVQAVLGDVEIISHTPEGKFPPIERVMPDPQAAAARALVNRQKLIDVLGPYKPRPCFGSLCIDSVSLHFAPYQLGVVFRPGTEGAPISSVLVSQEETEALSIALSAYVLLPALEGVPDEWVRLYASSPLDPVLIVGSASRAIVSPLQKEHVCIIEHPDWNSQPVQQEAA